MTTPFTSSVIYLDYCATTPTDIRVLEAMLPYFARDFGNAASQHHFGRIAGEAVELARSQVSGLLKCLPSDVVWTSGATESNNLAIKGVARSVEIPRPHLITQATEHKAVLDPFSSLHNEGFEVTVLDVDSRGRIEPENVRRAIRPNTVLVSVMTANNETGTIFPIKEIARVCEESGVVFHTDASQAVGKIPFDVGNGNIDLASLSGHKLYAPKGIGALIVRKSKKLRRLNPLIDGGGHERGMRSGTLNVPAIVGFGKACEIVAKELFLERPRVEALRNNFEALLMVRLSDVRINGDTSHRLPNVSNLAFLGIDAEGLMIALDRVAASTGSACTASLLEPSHVLRAMNLPEEQQFASARFSFGRQTTVGEVEEAVDEIVRTVNTLRNLSSTSVAQSSP